MCNLEFTVYSVQFTLKDAKLLYVIIIIECEVSLVQCAEYREQCVVCSVQLSVLIFQCAVCSMKCAACRFSVQCRMLDGVP